MDPLIKKHINAVAEYLGMEPNYREIAFLNDTDWKKRFGDEHENLFGKAGALFTKDRDILVRGQGHESLLHELLHATGLEEHNISSEFNEGFTELVAREIAAEYKLPPTVSGYTQIVTDIKNFVVPLTGFSLRELAIQYANAQDKSKLLSEIISRKYAHHFSNREDWGDNGDPRVLTEALIRVFRGSPFTPHPYLEYLTNKVISKNESFFHFLRLT
jgi:hypothetical protein